MTVLYIVTAGDYSDYHIQGVFSSREKAQNYINACSSGWSTPCIEEYVLNELSVAAGLTFYFGRYNPGTGEVSDVRESSSGDDYGTWQQAVDGTLFTVVASKSPEHAVKSILDNYRSAHAAGRI